MYVLVRFQNITMLEKKNCFLFISNLDPIPSLTFQDTETTTSQELTSPHE